MEMNPATMKSDRPGHGLLGGLARAIAFGFGSGGGMAFELRVEVGVLAFELGGLLLERFDPRALCLEIVSIGHVAIIEVVGEGGFEPPTTSTQSSCTTGLCDSPESFAQTRTANLATA